MDGALDYELKGRCVVFLASNASPPLTPECEWLPAEMDKHTTYPGRVAAP